MGLFYVIGGSFLMTKDEKKLKFVFLSDDFYKDYDTNTYKEILKKDSRPYVMFIIKIDNIDYAVPFRTNINHKFAYFTNPPKKCGIDYKKAIVVTKSNYLDESKYVLVNQREYINIRENEDVIIKEFKDYLKKYKKAIKKLSVKRNYEICKFSSLEYFHKEMGIEDVILEPTL